MLLRLFFGFIFCAWLTAGSLAFGQQMRGMPRLNPIEAAAVSSPAAEPPEEDPVPAGAPAGAELATNGTQGLDKIRGTEGQAFGETPAGVPYSSVFRKTGGPLGGWGLPSGIQAGVKSEEGTGEFRLSLPQFHAGLPSLNSGMLQRGFSPQEADFKFGPVFVRLGSLSGALLASDNINLTEDNREAGSIAVIRLGMTVLAQLTEGWRLSLAGTLSYLPFTGEFGLGVRNNLHSSLLFGVDSQPLLSSQLSYETKIAGWSVIFSDDLHVSQARFYSVEQPEDSFAFFALPTHYEDRAGRYAFVAPTSKFDVSNSSHNRSKQRGPQDVGYLSNVVSAATTRLMANNVRASARAFHENFWYFNNGQNLPGRYLPEYRDLVSLELASERENLRFKPFAGYEAVKTDLMRGFNQTAYAGFRGPITQQLTVDARAGLLSIDHGNSSMHWKLELVHTAGPYTVETLSWFRAMSEFQDQTVQVLQYHLAQVLGPDLKGNLFARIGRTDTEFPDLYSQDEFRAGAILTYLYSPKTEMSLGVTFAQLSAVDSPSRSQTWTGRYDLVYHATDTLTAHLLYQYQKFESNWANNSYYENLVRIMLTKTFH